MKILIVSDVLNWAIGQLSNVIRDENKNLEIKVIAIHPKELRSNQEYWKYFFKMELEKFNPDLVHFQYWDHVQYLASLVKCKKILTHHNQKNLLSADWQMLDHIVVHTQKAKKILNEAGYNNVTVIQHGIDIEYFNFLENYDDNVRSIGYVGRIVPWKGLYNIAKVAKEIDSEVICMGKIDKADYWQKVQEFSDVLDLRFNTPREEQVNVYHEFGVYVGNSCDSIEEGTLGLLEAMACGIPIITTPSGEANDIVKDGENGILVEFENYENLKIAIEKFYKMPKSEKEKMRQNAWNTVKNLSKERMARNYEKLYYKIVFEKNLVSIIIPTHNRAKTISKIIETYKNQNYSPIEIIVINDNSTDETEEILKDKKIKYINTHHEGYGLAKARNMGIFEASGHYIIFSDDRLLPENDAVEKFITKLSSMKEKSLVWGNKGAGKRDFIENFFAIRKRHIAEAGMFNERIDRYGGQSQEIRERLKKQGFRMEYSNDAKSSPLFGTKKNNRRYDIFNSKLKLWKLEN